MLKRIPSLQLLKSPLKNLLHLEGHSSIAAAFQISRRKSRGSLNMISSTLFNGYLPSSPTMHQQHHHSRNPILSHTQPLLRLRHPSKQLQHTTSPLTENHQYKEATRRSRKIKRAIISEELLSFVAINMTLTESKTEPDLKSHCNTRKAKDSHG
jgi:hypothetical protein